MRREAVIRVQIALGSEEAIRKELRVMRSSAVRSLLSRIPGVETRSGTLLRPR
ncbi:MAG: hypothetical protein ACJ790_21395 [Myxococcaceae bacterium]